MSWKPKYFIVYPYSMVSQINWPEGWGNKCADNVSSMLREVLNTEAIGSEIKLIWNDYHRNDMLKKNNITNQDLDDYIKSDCTMLSFLSEGTMKRAAKALKNMGGEGFVCVNNYTDMILQQIYYRKNKKFDTSKSN